MAGKKVIAICQSGGEFETDKDGTMSYRGGDAHAMEIDEQMKYNDFKMEVAEMFNCSLINISIKYFLPGNKKTLITISNDKDLKRMIKFHGDSSTTDIYVMTEEVVTPDVSNMPASRSSRTTLSEAGVLVDASLGVVDDVVDDTTPPGLLLDSSFDVVDDATHVDAHVDIPTEMPSSLHFVGSHDEKHIKAAQQWQNNITGVGQRFNSVHEFREALRKYAIAHQFAFKYKKNDSHRVTVKCKAEGCPWRIHASRLSTTQLICIKKMNATHTCEGAVVTTGYQATRSWVASIIKEKLKNFPNYKPKDIVNDIKQEYGIQLNYFQAWRGKEIAKEQLQGSYKEAYSQLPFFCEKIMETNPGSLATFTTKDDSSFHRLFVSFHASLYGFQQGCRPLIFLDSIPLKSKYQGTLLAATAADGDDGVFPVAFAVVDAETDDNWRWFLLQLKSALSTPRGITFVADREKGLRESIGDIFRNEGTYHGYCLRYLTEELIRNLKGQFSHEVKRLMVEDFYAAAYAARPESFQRCLESIKSISLEAYNWVMQSEPVHWANAFFQGARYNHMTSNFGELFYSWVSDAHELPITQMVDAIRGKIMELIYTRRADSNQWLTRLTPSMEEKLEKESLKVRSLQVLISAGNRFEVRGDSVEVVDMDHWDCSCKSWQLTGLPCCHAIAVISCLGRNPYDYCSRYLTTDSYRLTYSESVHPIPNVDRSVQNDSSQGAVTVNPPPTRRPPGRPTTKRFGSQEVVKRQLQCSRCKRTGHNKSTCKEFLLEC
uniref:SWIM-type domain-containing protein n=1 Tax=Davidia involucrata TaxID=16924 RepID=A0A5B6YXA9_DAVIN